MIVQHMCDVLANKLTIHFPDIPLSFREDDGAIPQAPCFQSELALAELVPLATNRYAARFRFRISYVSSISKPVALIMDKMLESLTVLQVEGKPCRASAVAWERPEDKTLSENGYFRAEYVIQMESDQEETGIKMQTLKQGGGLK
ncbi:hypothetical protein MNQ98_24855 [Paenibacillus sp. N3/727]|uniref:phage tail terminator family protein n=1 Tax=Paenibacillus sp. N3/727 TaxID=2925845 RepID=UPI001F5321A9|nr:hypothetical protein [Paenibacillus sp. N3/727]UNK17652.1 hypothetical protein MNQ98_24855 [Paenibacillus sp. N3/727]